MNKKPKFDINGKTYNEVDEEFDAGFSVNGFYYNSTRKFHNHFTSSQIAWHINLWRGRVWGKRKDGSRQLLKTVYN